MSLYEYILFKTNSLKIWVSNQKTKTKNKNSFIWYNPFNWWAFIPKFSLRHSYIYLSILLIVLITGFLDLFRILSSRQNVFQLCFSPEIQFSAGLRALDTSCSFGGIDPVSFWWRWTPQTYLNWLFLTFDTFENDSKTLNQIQAHSSYLYCNLEVSKEFACRVAVICNVTFLQACQLKDLTHVWISPELLSVSEKHFLYFLNSCSLNFNF